MWMPQMIRWKRSSFLLFQLRFFFFLRNDFWCPGRTPRRILMATRSHWSQFHFCLKKKRILIEFFGFMKIKFDFSLTRKQLEIFCMLCWHFCSVCVPARRFGRKKMQQGGNKMFQMEAWCTGCRRDMFALMTGCKNCIPPCPLPQSAQSMRSMSRRSNSLLLKGVWSCGLFPCRMGWTPYDIFRSPLKQMIVAVRLLTWYG